MMSAVTQAIKAYQDALALGGDVQVHTLWTRYGLSASDTEFIISEAKAASAQTPSEPDYFLKVTKQKPPDGTGVDWHIYTSIGGRLGPFTRDGALHFINIALAASQKTERLITSLRREIAELDRQIRDLES